MEMPKDNIKELIGNTGRKIIRDRQDKEMDHSDVFPKAEPENDVHKALTLFISYDVVNSATYKDLDAEWPHHLMGIFHEIERRFDLFEADKICPVRLWRIVRDEITFTVEVQSQHTIVEFIKYANEILLDINENIRNTTVWKDRFIGDYQHIVRDVMLKATAWISIVDMNEEQGKYHPEEDESIHMLYQNNAKEWFREYYGNDIDAGYRLGKYSRSDRMVLSFELAYLLEKFGEGKYLHIIAYERLEDIWRNRLYPIIWYYRPKDMIKDLQTSFDKTFTYDAACNDPLVEKYLDVRQNIHYKNALHPMTAEMYDAGSKTMEKIASDIGVVKKINKMTSLL